MSDKFDVEFLEVGDTYQGGPIEQSYFISAVLAAGGEVEINGSTVEILQLPKKTKAPVEVFVEEIIAAEQEAVEAELEELSAPEEMVSEGSPVTSPTPKPRGRKPKAAPAPESTEE